MHQSKKELLKCIDTKTEIHIVLLQLRMTPLEPGLLSPADLLFTCTMQENLNNDEHYETLVTRKRRNDKN